MTASLTTAAQRRRLQRLPRAELERLQLEKLNRLLQVAAAENPFYCDKLRGLRLPLESLQETLRLPQTHKEDLIPRGDDKLGLARHHTWPVERYVRSHQTSGTQGRPLRVLDTAEDWQWWLDTWQYVLDAARLEPTDCAFFAFSFGPFIGFWSAFEASIRRGCLAIPSGGLSSQARLEAIRDCRATALFCTPGYALHLAELAQAGGLDLVGSDVRVIVVAGEPGGTVPATRQRIEAAWGAKVIDHAGATEVGPWGYGDEGNRGLHVVETEFLVEFESIASGQPANEGEPAELIVTSLARFGCPVIRYRTGDLVRPVWNHGQANQFVLLEGGVLGRVDDMLIIRGVNVFPGAIEQVLRGNPEVGEFRVTAFREREMDQLKIEIELAREDATDIAAALHAGLGLRVEVRCLPPGSLPRFEGKTRRFVDLRS